MESKKEISLGPHGLYACGKIHECLHTPDQWDYLTKIQEGDEIVQSHRCRCGKTVYEKFTYSETIIEDDQGLNLKK